MSMDFSRKLPIGIQDFGKLITGGFVYVDKTKYIYNLAQNNTPYFLSRPRRFGKSLFLSTLEAYFLGKKELFKGLEIEKYEKEWIEYPVIKISFGSSSFDTYERFIAVLDNMLNQLEKQFSLDKKSDVPSVRLQNLIKSVFEKTGKQVVILLDEYDKPILDAIYTEYEEKNRAELRAFYSPLKDCDKYIRFLFITGITKISHLNIFSGLNQLNDISMTKTFSSICGVSETELKEYFMPEIEALAKEQEMTVEETLKNLADLYDGYHFTYDVEGVYNPFCLLKCFFAKDFGYFWFESGTPSLLIKALQNQPLELSTLVNGRYVKEFQFKEYDPDSKNVLPVIYQSGYLTIKGFEKEDRMFLLDFPNKEVEECFLNILLKKFITVPYDDMGLEISNIKNAIRQKDADKVLSIIKAAVADLPTIVKKDICENYYEAVTHLIFRLTGFNVISELQSVAGRSDIVLTTKDSVFIFELKMDKGGDFERIASAALEQITSSGYAERFAVSGKQMIKAGVVFSSDGKGLLGWRIE